MDKVKTKKPKYLSNNYLVDQIKISKQQNKINNELAHSLVLLVKKYASKPNWSGYSYIDEMKQEAILQLCSYWYKFDPEFAETYPYYKRVNNIRIDITQEDFEKLNDIEQVFKRQNNPFSYYTQIIYNVFLRYIKNEKKKQEFIHNELREAECFKDFF